LQEEARTAIRTKQTENNQCGGQTTAVPSRSRCSADDGKPAGNVTSRGQLRGVLGFRDEANEPPSYVLYQLPSSNLTLYCAYLRLLLILCAFCVLVVYSGINLNILFFRLRKILFQIVNI
jgi:hypothetical protein